MDRPTDGVVYGQPPSKLPDVPDIEGMFEAADVPKGDGSSLPHSLEWYAGAKDRQKVRDAETEELVLAREELRNEWTDMAAGGMQQWITNVEDLANLMEPQDINALLARTMAERPADTNELDKLKGIVDGAEARRAELREANSGIIERLRIVEEQIRLKQQQDQAEDEARKERERIAREKKARSEEALRKAQALMYGEDPEGEGESNDEDGDGEDEPAADAEGDSGAVPALRQGLNRELPPLADPPLPPPLQ